MSAVNEGRLSEVRRRGRLRVAVSTGIVGMSWTDASGARRGMDVDTARALAAATLGDPGAIEFIEVAPHERMKLLAAGEIDLLSSNATWTLSRECEGEAVFLPTTVYDGGAFMVKSARGVTKADELAGTRLAVLQGTSSAASLSTYFAPRGLAVTAVPYETPGEALAAYDADEVDGYVCDRIVLAGERTRLQSPASHLILEETISHEPMGPAVRDDDAAWVRLNRWVIFALIAAEEAGLTSSDPRAEGALTANQAILGAKLRLDEDWISRMIEALGNYGEIYDRNLGGGSGLSIPRGANDLWSRGGLQASPPMA